MTDEGQADLLFMAPSVFNLIRPAWEIVADVKDETVAGEARRILSIVADAILDSQYREVDVGHLPQIHAFYVQDGSILIEWIFDDFRVGFGIEKISSESSWYFVSHADSGDTSLAGDIPQNELETRKLILDLLTFCYFTCLKSSAGQYPTMESGEI